MSSVRRFRLLAAAAVVASLGACRDPVGASVLSGRRYALDRAGDTRLPVVLQAAQGDSTVLLADTIAFYVPPQAIRTLVYRYASRAGTHVDTIRAELEFRLDGSRVELGSFKPCGPTAFCAPNLVGSLGDAAMVVTAGNPAASNAAPWRYGRVPDGR